MNDQTIQMIAQAVIANTKVIQSLIDALPHDTKQAVAEVIKPVAAPVAPAPAPVVQAAPLVQPAVAAPASAIQTNPAPSQPVAVAMPAPPTFAAPAPAPTSGKAPFSDGRGLIDYVMGAYKALGQQKGALIQNVLTHLGYQNINDVKPEHYDALYSGVEALKG